MSFDIKQPDKIQNIDVLDVTRRIDRGLLELFNSQSATSTESPQFDIDRWKSVRQDIKRKFDIYAAAPQLDLPHYHPEASEVPAAPALEDRQNPDVQAQMKMLIALRHETLHSESAERSSGFTPADANRFDAVLTKWGALLEEIEANPQIDTPNADDQDPSVKK